MRLVFSGGTSLSKGFGLIQRFSEDLDFSRIESEKPKSDFPV
jgi:predicted nucleotidyltransferase component of viral defense system